MRQPFVIILNYCFTFFFSCAFEIISIKTKKKILTTALSITVPPNLRFPKSKKFNFEKQQILK